MIENTYISLKVCGRPHENSGFNPLVYYNSPLFDVPDTVYSGFNDVPYFFSVIIEKTQVVYTIIMNNVRSYQGFRLGNLKIAMSIPKGYKISNGKTPYDALVSIKDYFIASCMTCKDPVRLVYEFNSGVISPTLLDNIALEFPLEYAAGPYHSMLVGGSRGYIILPEEQIKLLLSDVQYPEFSKYGEIVIAQSVQATNYTPIVNLQVPRKSRFAIIIDGVEDGYVENPDEKILVKGKKDPRFYDNQLLSFTVSDVRKGQVRHVVVDEEKEIVSMNTTSLSTAKSTKVHIVFPKEVEGYFYTFKKDFQLIYDSGYEKKVIILDDYVFTLNGEEIGWLDNPSNFRATFNRVDEYRIKPPFDFSRNQFGEYQLTIAVDKVVKTKPIDHKPSYTDPDVIKVDVHYKEPPYNDTVSLYSKTQNGDEVLLSTKVSKSRGVFYIPKAWKQSTDALFVRYETSEKFYTSSIIQDRKSNAYLASDFEAKTKTFIDKKIKPNKTLIASVISILLGFFLGCVSIYYILTLLQKGNLTIILWINIVVTKDKKRISMKIFKLILTFVIILGAVVGGFFLTQEDLTSHINSEHLTEVCDVCNERFSSQEELKEHKNISHPTYVCEICNERFNTESKLNDHKKTHETTSVATKPFKCMWCNQSYDKKADLEWHIKDKHKSKFKCRFCGDTWFNTMTELDNHMHAHHNRYECPYCGQDTYYATKRELDKHIMDKHRSDEK